jgi:succinoglycan biosynthesis protein ExoA
LSERPLISVIVPVRNESGCIGGCLAAILAQSWGREAMEVLVVDGRSTDATRELARAALEGSGVARWEILDNAGQIAPCALNLGVRAARGEILARVDGHCEIDPDYLRNAVRHLREFPADGAGGRLETLGQGATAEAIAAAMSSAFGVGGSAFRLPASADSLRLADTIAFPVYTRAIVERVGAFDEELVRNQDDEYNFRLRKLGGRLVLAGDMRARYFSRSSFRRMARQYFEYGVWKVRVLQKHPRQMSVRHFVPAAFVLALAVGLALLPWTQWPLLGLAGAYAAANLAATIATGARNGFLGPSRWDRLLRLSPAFALLHLGYGAGFLGGLVRFAGRWGKPEGRA